ncbi:hypothetical protein FO519_002655 [Halicephalobus sp. NKZ332]|nr:hypothetical protein FO519_002655 [Halicephalobus sp. NKZ332]
MAMKKRSFSTISAISNFAENNIGNNYRHLTDSCFSESSNSTKGYRHLTDLSPEVETRSIDAPKKRLFLKKANLNFMRKKKGDLKSSTSMSNLSDEKILRESSVIVERPLSDPGNASRNFRKNGKSYFLYGSFSFGEDRYSKSESCNRNQIPRFSYRLLIHGSDWTTGTDWSLIGCSEIVSLSVEECNSQFSFVTPFEVKYDYEADTTLRLELQRARLSEKYYTFGFYSNPGINSIEKGKRRKSETMTEAIRNTRLSSEETKSSRTDSRSSVTDYKSITTEAKFATLNQKFVPKEAKFSKENTKFTTVATLTCDLNGLVNRGFLNSSMKMKDELASECSIYLAAESVDVSPNKYSTLNLRFSAKQRFDENNVRLLSIENNYRFLISKFFGKAEAFVPIFKSYVFGLHKRSTNYETEVDLLLNQQQFSKTDTIYRFALIEANTEKCLCFGDFRGSDFTAQDIEIPVTEASFFQSTRMKNDHGIFQTITPGIGFFRLRKSSETKSEVIDLISLGDNNNINNPSPLSRTPSLNEKNLNSTRFRVESERDSQRSSKTASFINDPDFDVREDEEDTVIVNGYGF